MKNFLKQHPVAFIERPDLTAEMYNEYVKFNYKEVKRLKLKWADRQLLKLKRAQMALNYKQAVKAIEALTF